MPTTVVHSSKEPFDIYIGRGTKWGNPFKMRGETRTEIIDRYRNWIKLQPDLLADLHELKGKRLGCHCKPNACHGDVLKELADAL